MLILIFTCPKIDKDEINQESEGCQMTREESEQYLYYAMTIGEQLLCCGAEVGRVEDTIRRICLAYGATRADVFSITSSIVTTIYPMRRKTPCFSYGDIRRVHRIYASD